MASKLFSIVALALAATTLAYSGGEGSQGSSSMTVEQAATQCGNGQVMSCCNTKSFSLDLNILGGNCSPLDLSVLLQVPIDQACNGQQAACCTGSTTVRCPTFLMRMNTVANEGARVSSTFNATLSTYKRTSNSSRFENFIPRKWRRRPKGEISAVDADRLRFSYIMGMTLMKYLNPNPKNHQTCLLPSPAFHLPSLHSAAQQHLQSKRQKPSRPIVDATGAPHVRFDDPADTVVFES